MRRLITAAAVCAAMCAAIPAQAQFAKPADAIWYRQGAMTLIGAHFGRIGQMVQGRVPFDAKVAADNADVLLVLSKLPFTAFGPGTETGENTKAKPAIWTETDKFNKDATDFQDKVVKLNAAAKTGDLAQIKTAFGDVGQSCKACHDSYRAK
jgi:cytochrome c556